MTVKQDRVKRATHLLLEAIGEDPDREGLRDTPARVARFWAEFMDGDHGTVNRIFPQEGAHYDEMIVLRGIRFYSLCEHHLLPFTGTATVGYVPNGAGLLGLSKLARIVRRHAASLQVQERLTAQVADEVMELTGALGVGVYIEAVHLCAAMRGVRSEDSAFVTSVMRGVLLTKPEARAEFLSLARHAGS